MNLLKQIVFAGSMAIFASTAHATTKDLGDRTGSSITTNETKTDIIGKGTSFNDDWLFSIDPAQSVAGFFVHSMSETSGGLLTVAFDNLAVVLYNSLNAVVDTWNVAAGETLGYNGVLGADSYRLNVSGTVTGEYYGNYSFGATFADAPPVPEPETYALMLAGLGLVGFMARRRKTGSSQ